MIVVGVFFIIFIFLYNCSGKPAQCAVNVILYGSKYRLHYQELQNVCIYVMTWLKANAFRGGFD